MQKRKVVLYPTLIMKPLELTLYRMDESENWEDRARDTIEQELWNRDISDMQLDVLSFEWLTDAEET